MHITTHKMVLFSHQQAYKLLCEIHTHTHTHTHTHMHAHTHARTHTHTHTAIKYNIQDRGEIVLFNGNHENASKTVLNILPSPNSLLLE